MKTILFTQLIDSTMIKWNKWILELLPIGKRTLVVYALCAVLVSPIVRLYGEFVDWRTRMRVKSGGTPCVCMLRRIIKEELGIDVLIEEGNGKSTDFIIRTSFVNTDVERKLFALLDKYKLAGKSFGYKNSEILYDSRWIAYLCEKTRSNVVTVTFYYYEYGMDLMTIESELAVESDLNLHVVFIYQSDNGEGQLGSDFILEAGKSYFEIDTWNFKGFKEVRLSPESDVKYDYVLKIIEKHGVWQK